MALPNGGLVGRCLGIADGTRVPRLRPAWAVPARRPGRRLLDAPDPGSGGGDPVAAAVVWPDAPRSPPAAVGDRAYRRGAGQGVAAAREGQRGEGADGLS